MRLRLRWVRRVLFVLLALAVLYVAARLVGGAVSASRLEDALERARATGAPLTLADAMPAPIPDAVNAAVLLREAHALIAEERDEMWEHIEVLQEDPRALSDEAARLFEAWIEQNQAALANIDEALRRPRCAFERDLEAGWASVAEHVPLVQQVSRLLSVRGYLRIRDGDVDRALASSRDLVRLGRCVRSFPSLVDVLVGMGIEWVGLNVAKVALASGAPSAGALRDLAQALDARPPGETLVPVFTFERAFGLHGIDAWEEDLEDQFTLIDDEVWTGATVLRFLFPTTGRRLDEARFLTVTARTIDLASRPYAEAKADWNALVREGEDPPWYDCAAHATAEVHEAAVRAWEVFRAEMDLLRIALRVELYEIEHGTLPATLEGLEVPGGTRDRLGTGPYGYRTEEGGYVLYSVGPDGVDEGGRETHDPRESGDVVWRRPARPRR